MILTRYQSLELGNEVEPVQPATHHRYGFKVNFPQAILLSVLFIFLLFHYYPNLLAAIVQARAIIKAEPPFAIMHINEPWTALSGLSQAEAEGRPLSDSLRLHSSQVGLRAQCSRDVYSRY